MLADASGEDDGVTFVEGAWWVKEDPAVGGLAGFVVVLSGWSSVCRDLGDGGSGGGLVDDALVGRERGDEGLDREVVHGSG